jgi:hypothetical protein
MEWENDYRALRMFFTCSTISFLPFFPSAAPSNCLGDNSRSSTASLPASPHRTPNQDLIIPTHFATSSSAFLDEVLSDDM